MSKEQHSEAKNALARELRHALAGYDNLVCAYLFGSEAKGRAGSLSDIDIAVLMEPNPDIDNEKTEIESSLCNILGRSDVDLIVLNEAPFTLAYRVLRDGIVLTVRNPRAKENFEVMTIMNYLDFQPVLQRALETSRQEILKVR